MIWLTADQHYFHENILKYENRPWTDINSMNEALIERHNERVAPEDTVFMLGDFAMVTRYDYDKVMKLLSRLNGNMHLILGNHDVIKPFTYVNAGFLSVHTSLTLERENVFLSHDPSLAVVAQSMGYRYCFCGHVHSLFTFAEGGVLNVGVDVHEYAPVALNAAIWMFDEYMEEQDVEL